MKYIIFDADFTLLDFEEDERRAIRAAYLAAGRNATESEVETARAFSDGDWAERGLWSVHETGVQQQYHTRYEAHLAAVGEYLHARAGGERHAVAGAYERELFAPATLLPQAEESVKELAKTYRVCVATNGLSRMQRGRLSRLAPYLYEIFVSEELGFIKPQREFFLRLMQKLGASPRDCVMVGDSLESDVAGAQKAGMGCVWLNRARLPAPQSLSATEADSLTEALQAIAAFFAV